MTVFDLRVELLSDTCVGGGNNVTGEVDTEVTTDAYGIPEILGKRLKGLCKENSIELMELGLVSQETIDKLFGISGGIGEKLIFQTLHTEGYEELQHFIKCAKDDENWARYTQKSKVQEFFTTTRIQTALEEEGVAKKNSLRNIRVVKKGTVFYGTITSKEPLAKEEIEVVKNCVKMIRHMGTNRTRGMGNVKCTIEKITELPREIAAPEVFRGDSVLPVRITLNQPCAIEKNFISGNILRACYIAAYMAADKKWKTSEEAHEDPWFRQLFLGNQVKFGYCFPLKVSEHENREKWYLPTPYTFVKEKKSSGREVFDLAACEAEDLLDELEERERWGEEFVCLDGNKIYTMPVERTESYHHRRAIDRTKGHAKGNGNDAKDGQLYTREAMTAGQVFYGEICGPAHLVAFLKELLPEGATAHMGASRTAEYGEVKISYTAYKKKLQVAEPDDKTVVTLVSPMVVTDSFGNVSTSMEDVMKTIFGNSVENVKVFSREEMVNGYNAKWNMPVPQRKVLTPGSVFVIYGEEIEEEEIEKMNHTFYGLYQNEGYGRIRVNMHGKEAELEKEKDLEEKQKTLKFAECGCKSYVNACLMDMLRQFCKKEDSAEIMGQLRKILEAAPNSNVLSGMQQICNTSSNFKELVEQLDKAIDRATKKNSNWFEQIKTKIVKKETIVTDIQNEFYDTLEEKIRTSKLEDGYKGRIKELLQENSFKLFREMFTAMIYDVHLVKGKRGKKYEQ